ncbi:hypothetical protein Tco_0422898 [Tanacetum coccineum]
MELDTGLSPIVNSVKPSQTVAGIRVILKQHENQNLTPLMSLLRALRSPRRELRNELNYVQSGVKMNEISCLKVRHVEHKIWETRTIPHRPKCEVRLSSLAVQQLWTLYPGK